MCGIAGRFGVTPIGETEAMLLAHSFETALAKRGPDGWGYHHDGDVLIVHRRLAIIDLSPAGSQPLWNEDATVCVVANGEIYNYQDLRQHLKGRGHRFRSASDSEVLVHLYEDGGIDSCCSALEGMYAFALWDARTREMYLVRDRLGIKPLVVAEHANGVSFASTLPALVCDPQVPRDLREDAFVTLLKWGFVPTPWSVVEAARRVEPGTWIRIRNGRVTAERRWWVDQPFTELGSSADARNAIERAVRSHLMSDVPVGVLLSSGIDSGIVTALAARAMKVPPIEAWTVRHGGFADDEYSGAAEAARSFGVLCHPVDVGTEGLTERVFGDVIAGMDEPLAVSSLVGLHALFSAIAPLRRVILTGDGGDELFGGYDWHGGMPAIPTWAGGRIFGWASPVLAKFSIAPGRLGTLGQLAVRVARHPADVYLDKLRVVPDEALEALGLAPVDDPMENRAKDTWDRFGTAGTLEQMLAVDRATALVDEMLAKLDSASMAFGVEARVPLLADTVLAAAKRMSAPTKRCKDSGKIFLREWYAEMGPRALSSRRKTGFNSPLGEWVQGTNGEFIREAAQRALRDLGGEATVSPLSARVRFSLATIAKWRANFRYASNCYSRG